MKAKTLILAEPQAPDRHRMALDLCRKHRVTPDALIQAASDLSRTTHVSAIDLLKDDRVEMSKSWRDRTHWERSRAEQLAYKLVSLGILASEPWQPFAPR
jgi:hypothetical protein